MQAILLRNVKVTDPASPSHGQRVDILLDQGMVQKIAPAGSLEAGSSSSVWESPGACVSPGWVDSCVYLSDPGHEHIESLPNLARAAAFGGFTAIACYPNTDPVVDNSQMIHSLRSRAAGLPVHMAFMGSVSAGAQGKELAEVYDMKQAGAIAFTDGLNSLQSAGMQLRALQYLQAFGGLLVTYPEEESLSHGGEMNEGISSTQLGMKGIPEIAEYTMAARLTHLLDYAGGRLHLQPMSSPKAIDLLSARGAGRPQLSLGVAIAHLVLDDDALAEFDTHFKVHPPLRSAAQVAALREALSSGKIDLICSAHQAQGIEEKQVEFAQAKPGMLGLQTCFSLAYTHLVQSGNISLDRLIELISHAPRKILGLPEVTIQAGMPADLTLFAPEEEWTFSSQHLFSRARNTPFLGQSLQGRVLGTYCKGSLHLSQ